MFKGNATGNPFAMADGKSGETGTSSLFTGTSANSSANLFARTEGNPFLVNSNPFAVATTAAGPASSSDNTISVPSENSSASATPGSFFTTPFTFETSSTKAPVTPSETQETVSKDSNTAGRQPFRPSIGLFGQAIGDALKGTPAKTTVTSPVSSEIQTLQSLYVSDIPDELMNKTLLTKHFSRFGEVIRTQLNVKRRSCTLNFNNHESAERAKTHGTKLRNVPLTIFWAKPANARRSDGRRSTSDTQSDGSPVVEAKAGGVETEEMRRVRSKKIVRRSVPKDYAVSDDVQDELNSMRNQNALSFSDVPPVKPAPLVRVKSRVVKPSLLSKSDERNSPSRRDSPSRQIASRSTASDNVEPLYGSTASMEDLQKVIRTPANTAEERFRVLEARDKLMRMKRVRESDLSKARINRGTCPDMCPEKERYHREFQRQVAVYEQSSAPGKIDHPRAVKQYSRSSADQEEPLSHELRPAATLRLTMDYITWRLMDICNKKDENMADWYHYIWDRTRGIRKDITQQELCDENTVLLVEQCARWHIVCSERLIAEDLMVYDDNINTENLTKCLQTLKYMYQDLSLKGVDCPNEAEFRAYFVLLNLTEGDCMWEVQQLSSKIRSSEAVHFALQVAAALSSNNYVHFFKLVRSTTYLNACILHRYFAQVRSRALHTIVHAYCARLNTAVFTLGEIVRLCGLGTPEEAAILCQHYGLKLTEDRTSVIFSRRSYSHPDTTLPASRVLSLVEAKRHCSIAETVSGGFAPSYSFESHVPHDSFDSRGVLKAEAWMALDQGGEMQAPLDESQLGTSSIEERIVIDHEAMRKEAAFKREQEMAQNKHCNALVDSLVDAVVHDQCCTIVEKVMKEALLDDAALDFVDEIFNAVTEEMASEICTQVLSEEIAREQQQIRMAQLAAEAEMLEKMRQKKYLQEYNKYLDEFMVECCKKAIQDELALERLQIKLTEDIIEEVVTEECRRIVRESIEEARTAQLEVLRARSQRRQLKYVFRRWQKYAKKSKYRNQSMADFPAWISNLSLDEQVSSLGQPDPVLIQNMNRNRFAANKSKLLALEHEVPTIPRLDIGSVIKQELSTRMKEFSCFDAYLFWKVLISVPDPTEAPRNSNVIKGWTDTVFSFPEGQSVSLSQVKPNSYETLTICVRSAVGIGSARDSSQGTNGIVFWVSHKDRSLASAQRRLVTLLSSRPKHPAIPVAVVLSGPMAVTNKQIHRELDLVRLREAGLVSYFKVFTRTLNTPNGLITQLEGASRWLAELAPPLSPLTVMTMRHLMGRCLTNELWGQVRASVNVQDPNDLVELYNAALEKLRELFFDQSLVQYSSGATEFRKYLDCDSQQEQRGYQIAPEYWSHKEYYDCVDKMLSDAQLQMITEWPPSNHSTLKDVIVAYCNSQGLSHVISDVYHVIEQHTRMLYNSQSPVCRSSDWGSFLKTMPWTFVIQIIVVAKLESLDFDPPADYNQHELRVVVNRDSLSHLRNSLWWLSELSLHDVSDSSAETLVEEERGVHKRSFVDDSPLPSKQRKLSLVDVYTSIRSACKKIDATVNAVKTTWAKVDMDGGKQQ